MQGAFCIIIWPSSFVVYFNQRTPNAGQNIQHSLFIWRCPLLSTTWIGSYSVRATASYLFDRLVAAIFIWTWCELWLGKSLGERKQCFLHLFFFFFLIFEWKQEKSTQNIGNRISTSIWVRKHLKAGQIHNTWLLFLHPHKPPTLYFSLMGFFLRNIFFQTFSVEKTCPNPTMNNAAD